MQKIGFLILPVVALAVLALVFVRIKGREPAEGKPHPSHAKSVGDAGSAAETARLRAELETFKAEVEKQRKRAAEAEKKLAEATAKPDAAGAEESKKPAGKKPDWKSRKDAELQAKVKEMAWRSHTRGVIDYWKELEKSRAEGRAPQMNPDMMKALNALQADMIELSKYLGLEGGNSYDVFQNSVVGGAWMDAFLQEIGGGALTDAQLAELRKTSIYGEDPDFNLGGGNILETWKTMIQRNLAYGTETAGILTQAQHDLVAKTVTPTFMLSLYSGYGERRMSGAAAVTDYWLDSFKLTPEYRAAVEPVAADFVRRQAELAQSYATQYGATLPRDAEFELRLKSLDLQIAAEKSLSESLQLDAEQAKKLLKGSGAVIRVGN